VLWIVLLGFLLTGAVALGIWFLGGKPGVQVLAQGLSLLELLRVALLVTGGVGAAVALVVAYRKQNLGERAERREVAEAELARRADQREEARLFHERFTSAAAQIASDDLMICLAGIYAMSALAEDWPAGRQMCVEVICGLLRKPPIGTTGDGLRNAEERNVRDSAFRLLVEHFKEGPVKRWSNIKIDLTGIEMNEIDFSECIMENVDLILRRVRVPSREAILFISSRFDNSRIDLSGSLFEEESSIQAEEAYFERSTINLARTRFGGSVKLLNRSTFLTSSLDFDLTTFEGANSIGDDCYSYGSNFSLIGAKMMGGVKLFPNASFFANMNRIELKRSWIDKDGLEIRPRYIQSNVLEILGVHAPLVHLVEFPDDFERGFRQEPGRRKVWTWPRGFGEPESGTPANGIFEARAESNPAE
jgi:hypothetical protein